MDDKSPQLENGYLKIANELWDALMQFPMSDHRWRILMTIMRKTYGFNKKQDAISLSQISKMTGIDRSNVCKTLKELVANGTVVRITTTPITNYMINKNYLTWQWPSDHVAIQPLPSGQEDNWVVARRPHTKDILTKDIKNNTPLISPQGEKRKTQLDENFKVEEKHREWAKLHNMPDPDEQVGAFVDHHLAKGSVMKSWDRAFYTWLRKAKIFGARFEGEKEREERVFQEHKRKILEEENADKK